MLIENIILLYIATFIVFYLHEIGHLGEKIVITRLFPLPVMFARSAMSRYGGLAVNALLFISVAHFQPELLFIQLIGAVAWIHFILYAIIGSFNKEIKVPRELWKFVVFDDVPNRLWFIFVPLGIIALFIYKDFYIPIFTNLFV